MVGISVHVTITIDPKDKDTFLTALKPTFDAVKAEPLNLFFEISYDEKNPGVFKLIESWNCTAEYIMSVSNTLVTATFCNYNTCIDQLCLLSMQTQLQKDYYKPYRAAVEPLLLKPFEVQIFNRLGSEWASVNASAYPARS
jgi:quinol monooxygenase YgiN